MTINDAAIKVQHLTFLAPPPTPTVGPTHSDPLYIWQMTQFKKSNTPV